MRPQDRSVFSSVAQDHQLWILVRRTNPESLKYMGNVGFIPKPIDCKPKTADRDPPRMGDRGVYRLGGLVADPTLVPEAFRPKKLTQAIEIWRKFKRSSLDVQHGPNRYAVVTDRRLKHFGALTLNGKYLFGDYDLYDLVDPANTTRNLALVSSLNGQPHFRGPKFYQVQRAVNERIGTPMIQHGGEYQYADHSDQSIDVFGPQGSQRVLSSLEEIRYFYLTEFGGRKSTKDAQWGSSQRPGQPGAPLGPLGKVIPFRPRN
jgi:hypothetical protein